MEWQAVLEGVFGQVWLRDETAHIRTFPNGIQVGSVGWLALEGM